MQKGERGGTGERMSNEREKPFRRAAGMYWPLMRGTFSHPWRRKDGHSDTDTGACVDLVVGRKGSAVPVVSIWEIASYDEE